MDFDDDYEEEPEDDFQDDYMPDQQEEAPPPDDFFSHGAMGKVDDILENPMTQMAVGMIPGGAMAMEGYKVAKMIMKQPQVQKAMKKIGGGIKNMFSRKRKR